MIFMRSKERAKALNKILKSNGFPTETIHGDMDQKDRLKIYQKFKDYETRILIATGMFNRGVDF